jgi:hypothetical protein
MARRPAENELAVAAMEAQKDVLCPAGQSGWIYDRTGFETASVHPSAKAIEIDQTLPAIAAHLPALLQPSSARRGTA